MSTKERLLAVFAHPDDESFTCGGTLALARQQGVEVAVVSATRGEVGEIADGVDATPATLGKVREAELRSAMLELGIEDVRFIGYRDSGIAGTADNDHPDALAKESTEKLAEKIVDIFDEFSPTVVVTFDHEGIYRHPDHIAVHHGVMSAVQIVDLDQKHHRPNWLSFAVFPREFFLEVWNRPGNPFEEMPYGQLITMGTPRNEITHINDVSAVKEAKRAAILAHRSQFGEDGITSQLDDDTAELVLRYEHFKAFQLPWQLHPAPSEVVTKIFTTTS
ncbi:PIG-L family deacetylase [soil metagenome]